MENCKIGDTVKFRHNGKIVKGTVVDFVPLLWGGVLPVVKTAKTELTLDPRSFIR